MRGQAYPLKVSSRATVEETKDAIKKEYNVIPVRLLFGGRRLKDTETLASCGIKTGNALVMTTKYIGGCGFLSVFSGAFGSPKNYLPSLKRSVGFS